MTRSSYFNRRLKTIYFFVKNLHDVLTNVYDLYVPFARSTLVDENDVIDF